MRTMKNTKSHSPNAGVKVVAGLLVASQVTSSAEEQKEAKSVETLEPTTVVATKFEKNLSDVSSSVAVLDVAELISEGKSSVQDAIGYRTPGVIATSTAGQRGQAGSLFVRGTTTNKSQMRLDGVRISDSTSSYANFLGSTKLYGLSKIEIFKGASSSVYGGGAIGGVVSLSTAKGEGTPTHSATAEYGSYNSWLGNLSSQGQVGDFSYNLGLTAEDTQNDSDAPVNGNDFTQLSYFGRFDYTIDKHSSLGMTLRGGDANSEYPQRGNPVANIPQKNKYDYFFGTFFYENQITEAWNSRVTLGYSKEDFDSDSYYAEVDSTSFLPTGNYLDSEFGSHTDRYSIYWDNAYVWSQDHTTIVGTYVENAGYETSYQNAADRDTFGVYVNHSWQVVDALQLNGTLGWDDHDDFGDEFTWNAGALYDVTDSTMLKANAGTAFRAPTFGEVDGNNKIGPESSFNWDFGVEQTLGTTIASITWFENDVEDLIAYQGFDATSGKFVYDNTSGKTKANGLEFALESNIEEIRSFVFASYTYYQNALATEIPEQTASAGIQTKVNDAIDAGLVATWVDQRQSAGRADLDHYFLVDIYSNYQLTENMRLHARVENLLDDDYRLSDFTSYGELGSVKGRGRGFYGAVTMTY